MKHFPIFTFATIISLLLGSCSPAPAVPPTVAVIPEMTATVPSTPTEIPATPTSTPTEPPTPTKDPNAPQEYTRHENGTYYLDKTENGKTITYEYTVLKDKEGNVLFQDWALEKTKDKGIPLGDFSDTDPRPDWAYIRLFVTDKALGGAGMPTFSHIGCVDAQNSEFWFTGAVFPMFFKRIHKGQSPRGMVGYDFLQSLAAGNVAYDFYTTTPDEMQFWNPSTSQGTTVIVDGWEQMEGKNESWDFKHKIKFRSELLGVDSKGNLVGRIAFEVPLDSLTEEQYLIALFLHSAGIIDGPNNSRSGLSGTLSAWIAFEGLTKSAVTGKEWVDIQPVK